MVYKAKHSDLQSIHFNACTDHQMCDRNWYRKIQHTQRTTGQWCKQTTTIKLNTVKECISITTTNCVCENCPKYPHKTWFKPQCTENRRLHIYCLKRNSQQLLTQCTQLNYCSCWRQTTYSPTNNLMTFVSPLFTLFTTRPISHVTIACACILSNNIHYRQHCVQCRATVFKLLTGRFCSFSPRMGSCSN